MSGVLCGRSVTEGKDLIDRFGPFEPPGKTATSPNSHRSLRATPVHALGAGLSTLHPR
jgi:hypothetical protein